MEKPNLSYINELSADDEAFKNQLITIVKNELPQEIEMYHNRLNNKDWINAAESIHKLKHKIGILGLEEGYHLAINYEEEVKVGTLTNRKKFEVMLSQMTSFINTLNE